MRLFAAAVLLAGCGAEPLISITMSESYTSATIVDGDCECLQQKVECWSYSDVGPSTTRESCECANERPCDDALVSVARHGEMLGSAIGAGAWQGDFRGATVYFRGCGGEATIELPSELPAPPANLHREGATILFDPPPGTEWTTVTPTDGSFYGTVCTVDGMTNAVDEPQIASPFTVTSRQRVPRPSTDIGVVDLVVTSAAQSSP